MFVLNGGGVKSAEFEKVKSELSERLEAKFVDSLPTSSVEGVPVSVERCSVSAGDDGYTITSGSNAANKYGLAHIDFTENAVDATSVIIEMDTQIPGGRWLIGLVDLSQRPGESYRTTYDKTGVIFTHGTKDGNYYYVNDVIKWDTTFKDNWFHVRTIIDFADKTVQYEITNRDTGAAVLSGTESFIDAEVTTVTGIEFYTWVNDSAMEIDNVNITVNHDVSENTLYITNDGNDEYDIYIYRNGVPVCLSGSRNTTYSETPQRIGTWIDGTPVWRAAFQAELPEDDNAWRAGEWGYDFHVQNKEGVIVLNEQAFLYAGAPCTIDDIVCTYSYDGFWSFPEKANSARCNGIYGWIEFATPEDNFKN